MKYFLGITDIEQAKLRHRKLAKQLHPDAGGTTVDFQEMQTEYKEFLLRLHKEEKVVTPSRKSSSEENELINELERLAKVLIKKQVPQNYLRQKIQSTESTLKRGLFGEIVNLLDSLE